MKKFKYISIIVFTVLFSILVGVYIGSHLLGRFKIQPLLEITAISNSSDVYRSALIFDALNNGKNKEAANILRVHIQSKLNNKDEYSYYYLSDKAAETVELNFQRSQNILEKWPPK